MMIHYFGYGSNINLVSLKAKGVEPLSSSRGVLKGWRLRFNVPHWFRHEGGVGNIEPSPNAHDAVEGIVHTIMDDHLALLDAVESYGVGYDRKEVEVQTENGVVTALTYTGLPPLDDNCLPTQRYLNIIIKGAEAAGLSEPYIEKLRQHPVHKPDPYPPYKFPPGDVPEFTQETLAAATYLTALCGAVFDMQDAKPRLHCLFDLFGGKDMTLFHVKRHDTSSGNETIEDVMTGNIPDAVKSYLNAYLHEYAREFKFAGRFVYPIKEPVH